LQLLVSDNGINGWRGISSNYNYSGVLRDPQIFTNQGDATISQYYGYYWLFHGNRSYGASNSFSVARSSDGVNWQYMGYVDCSAVSGDQGIAWAPKPFMDDGGGMHVLMMLSPTQDVSDNSFMYELHPFGDPGDVRGWSLPSLISGSLPPNGDTTISRGYWDYPRTSYLFLTETAGAGNLDIAVSSEYFTGYRIIRQNFMPVIVESPQIVWLPACRTWAMFSYANLVPHQGITAVSCSLDGDLGSGRWSYPQAVGLPITVDMTGIFRW
jgi:hypothetical protein